MGKTALTRTTKKFRAYDKVEKKWLFDYEKMGGFSLIGEITLMGQLNTIPIEKWKDIVIMQSIGIKDIHDKEIYEDDIILCHDDGIHYNVAWEEYDDCHGFHINTDFQNEVVGNIHDGIVESKYTEREGE